MAVDIPSNAGGSTGWRCLVGVRSALLRRSILDRPMLHAPGSRVRINRRAGDYGLRDVAGLGMGADGRPNRLLGKCRSLRDVGGS